MLHIIGLAFSMFMFFLLLLKKDRSPSDNILMMWVVLIAAHMLSYIGHATGFTFRYPNILGLTFPIPLLHGVFLYLYARSLVGIKTDSIRNILKHLIPAVLIVVLAIPFYVLPEDQKTFVFQNEGKGYEWFTYILILVIVVSGISYSMATILIIRNHRKKLLNLFSNIDKKMLGWLENLSIGLIIIWLAVIFFDDAVIFGIVSIFIFFMALLGINQVPVFYNYSNYEFFEPEKEVISKEKVHHTVAQNFKEDKHLTAIFERLEKLMESDKTYKDPDLTLLQLSSKLNLSPNTVSQTINSVAEKTFYQYINDFRIKEFIVIVTLPENQKFTLIALAYDCGFKSKTTFNKYFKQTTGMTPTEFLSHASKQPKSF